VRALFGLTVTSIFEHFMKYSRPIVATIILLVCGISVSAAVVYDESVNGDLPVFPSSTLLSFLPGSNEILGNTGQTTSIGYFDFDSFSFTIDSGDELVSASLSTTQTQGDLSGADFHLVSPNSPLLASIPGSGSIFSDVLPIGPGTYSVQADELISATSDPSFADYTFDFEVVPEPSTIALLALGAIGLLSARRRFATSSS
jgi:hypothetical protein